MLLLIPLEFLQLAKTSVNIMRIIYKTISYVLNIAFIFVLLLLNAEFLLTMTDTNLSLENLLKALLGDGIYKGKYQYEEDEKEITIDDLTGKK